MSGPETEKTILERLLILPLSPTAGADIANVEVLFRKDARVTLDRSSLLTQGAPPPE